jgi:hypothetical protein
MNLQITSTDEGTTVTIPASGFTQGQEIAGQASDGRTWTVRLDAIDRTDGDQATVWVDVIATQPRTGKQRKATFKKDGGQWAVSMAAADFEDGREVTVTLSDKTTKTVTVHGTPSFEDLTHRTILVDFTDTTPRTEAPKATPAPRGDAATPKQMALLRRLHSDHSGMTSSHGRIDIPAHLTKRDASAMIDLFMEDGI